MNWLGPTMYSLQQPCRGGQRRSRGCPDWRFLKVMVFTVPQRCLGIPLCFPICLVFMPFHQLPLSQTFDHFLQDPSHQHLSLIRSLQTQKVLFESHCLPLSFPPPLLFLRGRASLALVP